MAEPIYLPVPEDFVRQGITGEFMGDGSRSRESDDLAILGGVFSGDTYVLAGVERRDFELLQTFSPPGGDSIRYRNMFVVRSSGRDVDDVVAFEAIAHELQFFANDGQGQFIAHDLVLASPLEFRNEYWAVGDVNGDGAPDYLVADAVLSPGLLFVSIAPTH